MHQEKIHSIAGRSFDKTSGGRGGGGGGGDRSRGKIERKKEFEKIEV